jgi:hypothetical protein
MIAYCPLEDLEPPVQQKESVVEPRPVEVTGLEETELNYVVMAFIAGVIILAISDSVRA